MTSAVGESFARDRVVDGGRRFLLLHSPLVGPASLAPTASALVDVGHDVVLPDLTGVADEPRPAWMVDRALDAGAGVDVVVAHSGAGALLPVVAAGAGARAAVFLDAVLPEVGARSWTADDAQRALFEEHTQPDGRLRPWLEWWPPALVEQLLPDPVVRAEVAGACPRLPASFYDHAVPLPRAWVPSAYVALGGAYADEVRRAADHGWPVRSLGRSHLATVTHADEVAAAILEVLADVE